MSKFQKIFFYIYFVLALLSYPLLSFADWKGPINVIVGTWGTAAGQFYFEAQDTADLFPKEFAVDKDGNIIIRDEGNFRILIYNREGQLKKVIKKPNELPALDAEYYWPWGIKLLNNNWIAIDCDAQKNNKGKYTIKKCFLDYNGKIIKKSEWGEMFPLNDGYLFKQEDKYYLYSPTGRLLKTYTERPLELGVVQKRERQADGRYKYTVKYDNITYIIESEGIEEQGFQRDIFLNLFFVGRLTDPKDIYVDAEWEGNTVSERAIPHYIVTRYDRCDNSPERLHIPPDKSPFKKTGKGVIRDEGLLRQYGKPVVSSNGDVYCWKRTADAYSILKWTWQGPADAPQSLTVSPSQTSLALTWDLPQKDANSVTSYEINRSGNVCGPYRPIATVKKDILTYEDQGVKPGETWYYQVRAMREKTPSGYSNKAVGTR